MRRLTLLFSLLMLVAGCSPVAPTKTCLDPRIVAPGRPGYVGVVDEHYDIHWIRTDIPICPPDRLKPLR